MTNGRIERVVGPPPTGTGPAAPACTAARAAPPAHRARRPTRAAGLAACVAVLLAVTAAPRALAAAETLSDAQASEFLKQLQAAVRADDAAAVARLVVYPLHVNTLRMTVSIATRTDFVRRYRTIVTDHVRAAILAQRSAGIVRNWRGARIGKGEVWFASACANKACSKRRIGIVAVDTALHH